MSNLIPFSSGEVIPFDASAAVVASVTLSVPTISLEVGTSGWATATVRDASNNPLPGRTVTWDSASGSVIADPSPTVTNSSGVASVAFTALAAGTTSIQATCETVVSSAITVTVYDVADPPTYTASGSSQVILTAESRLAGWERPKVRRFNDADQRKVSPTDRFFEYTTTTVEQEVIWPSKELLRTLK